MKYSLNDKVVLITGAAGGIGAATAAELYARGARLMLTDLREADLDRIARNFDSSRCLTAAHDVTDMDATHAVVQAAVQRFGRLDIAIANAGIAWQHPKTVASVDVAEFEHIVNVDLYGVWRTVKAALPAVVRSQGQLVATASIYAFLNGSINAPYAVSKAGVESLMRSVRSELAGSGASATTLYPGWVKTPMTDVAFGGSDAVTRFIETLLPKPLRTLVTPETIARDLADGLERRAPRVISPKRWAPLSLLRGLVNAATDRRLDTDARAQQMIRDIDAESLAAQDAADRKSA